MKSANLFAAAILCALAAAACGRGFEITTPSGFVELEDQEDYAYRAVTADGLVVAVREIDHEPEGEITFWADAIANHMRRRVGYALLEQKEIKTSSGVAGIELRFGHDRSKEPHAYTVTVFANSDSIFLVEAGGTVKQHEEHKAAVDAAVQSFRFN